MLRRKTARSIGALILLSTLLGACGGGSGDDDDNQGSSNWDSMKWDLDDWARLSRPGSIDPEPAVHFFC